MSKSLLTIEKEYLKKEHEKSPLGKVEKKLRAFYDNLYVTNTKLDEETLKKVSDIREANEKRIQEYIDTRLKTDREAVDNFLLESMTEELQLIENKNDR